MQRLHESLNTKKEVIVAGDFNVDLARNRDKWIKDALAEWSLEYGLFQAI